MPSCAVLCVAVQCEDPAWRCWAVPRFALLCRAGQCKPRDFSELDQSAARPSGAKWREARHCEARAHRRGAARCSALLGKPRRVKEAVATQSDAMHSAALLGSSRRCDANQIKALRCRAVRGEPRQGRLKLTDWPSGKGVTVNDARLGHVQRSWAVLCDAKLCGALHSAALRGNALKTLAFQREQMQSWARQSEESALCDVRRRHARRCGAKPCAAIRGETFFINGGRRNRLSMPCYA